MPAASEVLRTLMDGDEIHIVPELGDFAAAKAAEINGFKVIMLSSAALSGVLTGIPDLGLLSLDEFVLVTDRICSATALPLIIDADNGFGRPLNAYHACQKLMKAGAAGVLITEAAPEGRHGVLPMDEAVLKFKAARDGLGDGFLIARVDVNPDTGFDEAIERALAYRDAGADMICTLEVKNARGNRFEMCRKIAAADPGWKWYPDLASDMTDVNIDDLAPLGYRLVGVHFSLRAAMFAMLDTGRHVFEERNNAYVAEHYKYTGFDFTTATALWGLRDGYWPNIERKYVKDPEDAVAVRNQRWCYTREELLAQGTVDEASSPSD
jgi:methylisocitrate lyase